MSLLVPTINQILSILTIVGQIGIIFLIAVFLLYKNKKSVAALLNFINKNAILIAFIIALASLAGSLFYSEIAGFEPCNLCWYQRIFIYPQVILLGLAFWKKDENIWDYILALSVIGAVIAGYQYLLQLGVAPALPCSAVGYSASCSQRFVLQFGYITIPLMAFTAFLLLIILGVIRKLKR